jgi:hypothetical protein
MSLPNASMRESPRPPLLLKSQATSAKTATMTTNSRMLISMYSQIVSMPFKAMLSLSQARRTRKASTY